MKFKIGFVLLILFSLLEMLSFSAELEDYPWFYVYGKGEGLEEKNIRSLCVFQDTLYVATNKGIYSKIKGKEKFQKVVNFSGIRSLKAIPQGIALASFRGAYVYLPSDKKLIPLKEKEFVYDIVSLGNKLYFSTHNGLFEYDMAAEKLNKLLSPDGDVRVLYPYNGELWAGLYGKGLYSYKNGKWENLYREWKLPLKKVFNYINDIWVEKSHPEHHLFVATDGGVLEVNLTTKIWQFHVESVAGTGGNVKLGASRVVKIFSTDKDPEGAVWFATPKGAYLYRWARKIGKDSEFFVGEVPKNVLSPADYNRPQIPKKCGCKTKWQHLTKTEGLLNQRLNDVVIYNNDVYLATYRGGLYKLPGYYIKDDAGWDYLYGQAGKVRKNKN